MRRFCKGFFMAVSAVVLFFGLVPAVGYGVVRVGVIMLLLFGAALLALTLLWDAFIGYGRVYRGLREVSDHRPVYVPRWWRRLRRVWAIVLALAMAGGAAVSVPMVRQAYYSDAPGDGATAVILGCQIIGGEPSLMLARRIDAAADYLDANPAAAVVCAGGRSAGDTISEAGVMRRVLLERGIADERIFVEEQSANTAENLRFSANIISENKLSTRVAIATDGFHQLRAAIYAGKNGLTAAALPSKTPWGLMPSYWVREWFALAKAVVFG